MDKKTINELRRLVDDVIYAQTKRDAEEPISRLRTMASQVNKNIDPYLSGKLREVISYAKEASGKARNKDHWISNVERSWYVFENGVQDDY